MTVHFSQEATGAASPTEQEWHTINWYAARATGASAPDSYREGNAGRPLGQGARLATVADPLI